MPPLSLEVTHSITLIGMFYFEHGVCVATYLPQNGFKCAVDLVSPLSERILIGILAWHFSHSLLRLDGHVHHFAQLFDLVYACFVPFMVFEGGFCLVLQDVHSHAFSSCSPSHGPSLQKISVALSGPSCNVFTISCICITRDVVITTMPPFFVPEI